MDQYLIGVDVGTTGTKAFVLDLKGNIIGKGHKENSCICPKSGWVEQDSEMLVNNAFDACKQAVISSGVNNKDILAIGFSVQRATFGLLDKQNKLIDNRFYVWQDNRAVNEIDYIHSKMPPEEMYKICGHPITPTFSFEKLIWLMRNDPQKYNDTEKIVFVSDYVLYRFGSNELISEVTNAGCSGMLNIKELRWADHLDGLYDIDTSKFLKLVSPATAVGKVPGEIAEKTGLAQGTLICTGSGDNQCGSLGAGVVEPGLASMSLGTSGVLVVASDQPVFESNMGLMVNPSSVKDLYQLEGIQLGAASSYLWAKENLAILEKYFCSEIHSDPYVLMENHINLSSPGSNGVIFMPFLNGAGYPYWDIDAKGLFFGIDNLTSRSDLIRSVMEGITIESKDMLENIKKLGIEIHSVTIIGGATKSPAWRQIIADMFNTQVRTLEVSDSAVVGAAILAGVGAGVFADAKEGVSKMVRFKDTVKPIADNVKIYEKKYQTYKKLYVAIKDSGVYDA